MSKAPAVDYALEIIEFFSKKNHEIGIADISNALNINKNAVSRVLEALLEKNWIYMSDNTQKKYRLTLRPFSLISGYVNNNSIAKIATTATTRNATIITMAKIISVMSSFLFFQTIFNKNSAQFLKVIRPERKNPFCKKINIYLLIISYKLCKVNSRGL